MSNRGDSAFLQDILEAIRRADQYIGNMSYEEFLGDLKT